MRNILWLSAVLLTTLTLAAGPMEQLREEYAPLFRALKADGVVFFWDQAVVLEMNVAGKAMTTITLSGTLGDRTDARVSLMAIGQKGAVKPVMLGLLLEPDKLIEQGGKTRMVGWSFPERKVIAVTMKSGTAEATPAAMGPEEAEALFKAYLPHTFAYLKKRNPGP